MSACCMITGCEDKSNCLDRMLDSYSLGQQSLFHKVICLSEKEKFIFVPVCSRIADRLGCLLGNPETTCPLASSGKGRRLTLLRDNGLPK